MEPRPDKSTDFSGTNPERIDKLVVAATDLRTTMRLFFAFVYLSFPMIVGLQVDLNVQSLRTTAETARVSDRTEASIARLSDQMDSVRKDLATMGERLDRLERPNRP